MFLLLWHVIISLVKKRCIRHLETYAPFLPGNITISPSQVDLSTGLFISRCRLFFYILQIELFKFSTSQTAWTLHKANKHRGWAVLRFTFNPFMHESFCCSLTSEKTCQSFFQYMFISLYIYFRKHRHRTLKLVNKNNAHFLCETWYTILNS